MARRSSYVIDIVEILVHWHAGRSQHELAASLNVDRKTIRYAEYGITNGLPVDTGLLGHRAQPSPTQPAVQHPTKFDH